MPLIGVSSTMPKLLARLEQMPDYSIFRGYVIASIHIIFRIKVVPQTTCFWSSHRTSWQVVFCIFSQQQYNLANDIEAANSYTIFAPNNDAIESYLWYKRTVTLVCIIHKALSYHHYSSKTTNAEDWKGNRWVVFRKIQWSKYSFKTKTSRWEQIQEAFFPHLREDSRYWSWILPTSTWKYRYHNI